MSERITKKLKTINSDTPDYRLQVKIKNNRILTMIDYYGYSSVNAFCLENGLSPSQIGKLINQKKLPITTKGEWTRTAERLAKALKLHPDMLFSESQKTNKLKQNMADIAFHEEALLGLVSNNPETLLIENNPGISETIEGVLDLSVSPRNKDILKMRFGIGYDRGHGIGECAEKYGISNERVNQIERNCLRLLRHPTRSNKLKPFIDEVS